MAQIRRSGCRFSERSRFSRALPFPFDVNRLDHTVGDEVEFVQIRGVAGSGGAAGDEPLKWPIFPLSVP